MEDLRNLRRHVSFYPARAPNLSFYFFLRWNTKLINIPRNAAIFPVVYFFYPETRYRSLEEMDDIFKKSSNVFDVVSISLNEPHRYDKHGQLKPEYIDGVVQRKSVHDEQKVEHSEGSS